MNLITKANRMCFTKRQYRSLIVAHCAIGKIMGRDPDAAKFPWRAYECPVCRQYHITKERQDKPEYQKRRWMDGLGVRDLTIAGSVV